MYPARLTSELATYASVSTKGVEEFNCSKTAFDSVANLNYDCK